MVTPIKKRTSHQKNREPTLEPHATRLRLKMSAQSDAMIFADMIRAEPALRQRLKLPRMSCRLSLRQHGPST
jgi:hypothetical protein